MQSLRLATGEEALVARVLTTEGKVGFGFSFRLDGTEARHMAEWAAGARAERPAYESQLDHPWERAWLSDEDIEWDYEPGFAKLHWLTE